MEFAKKSGQGKLSNSYRRYQKNLMPKEITKEQASFVYANEADLLNVALFGITTKEWRDKKPWQNRKHKRLCHNRTVGRVEQYGKYQCFAYRTRLNTKRQANSAKQSRDNTNEILDRK